VPSFLYGFLLWGCRVWSVGCVLSEFIFKGLDVCVCLLAVRIRHP